MAGYTRQSAATIAAGQDINAAPLAAEFNQLQAAFDSTTGHTHDGSVGGGPKLDVATATTGTVGVNRGGTGAATASAARNNLGLGSIATYAVGTSGATVPLLSTANTWAASQTFRSNVNIFGPNTAIGPSYLQFQDVAGTRLGYIGHGSGSNAHLTLAADIANANIIITPGAGGNVGIGGPLNTSFPTTISAALTAASLTVSGTTTLGSAAATSLSLTNDLAIADGGTGASTAVAAKTNLGLVAIASSGSASDLTTGTIPNARISGNYDGIGTLGVNTINIDGNIYKNTVAGSDTGSLTIWSASTGDAARGAGLVMYGANHASIPSEMRIYGNTAVRVYGPLNARAGLDVSGDITASGNLNGSTAGFGGQSAGSSTYPLISRATLTTGGAVLGYSQNATQWTALGYNQTAFYASGDARVTGNLRVGTISVDSTVAVSDGGTGATTAAAAMANIGSAVSVVAGNGLTGGGTMAASRTLTLGTPGTCTATSGNTVSSTSHTHDVDWNGGAATITAGSVGSYCWAYSATPAGFGTTRAGSALWPASMRASTAIGADGDAEVRATRVSSALSGSWRCMGGNTRNSTDVMLTLWQRYA